MLYIISCRTDYCPEVATKGLVDLSSVNVQEKSDRMGYCRRNDPMSADFGVSIGSISDGRTAHGEIGRSAEGDMFSMRTRVEEVVSDARLGLSTTVFF